MTTGDVDDKRIRRGMDRAGCSGPKDIITQAQILGVTRRLMEA